jgi:hypothetical protein
MLQLQLKVQLPYNITQQLVLKALLELGMEYKIIVIILLFI